MATDPIELQPQRAMLAGRGPSFLGRAWNGVRSVVARVAHRVADRAARVADGFMAHGWTGRLFLANFALGIAATTIAWLGTLVNALPWSCALLFAIFVQWRFLAALARFGRYARVAAIAMCALMVIFSAGVLLSGSQQRLFVLFLAELAFMVQCLVYFLSPSYALRAEEYHAALEAATEPEE
jgi:hypothetical protein